MKTKKSFIYLLCLFFMIAFIGCDSKNEDYTITEGNIIVDNAITNDVAVETITNNIDIEPVIVENSDQLDENNSISDISNNDDSTIEEIPSDELEVAMDENDDDSSSNSENPEEISNLSHDKAVDLIFFMGQSNMAGYGGNAAKAPAVSTEAGEEFRSISDPTKLYPITEPFGKYESNENGLTDGYDSKLGSLVSSFVNEYHNDTGKKVIAVSNAFGGMAMDLWLLDPFWKDSKNRVSSSIKWLQNNDYQIDNIYLIWYQGESDAGRHVPGEQYKADFYKFMESMFALGVQEVFVITTQPSKDGYDEIDKMHRYICESDSRFCIASTLPSELDGYKVEDNIHYNQDALNMIGTDAGKNVANYANSH